MPKEPRPIQTIIGASGSLRPLLREAREQARVTAIIRDNLPAPLPEHVLGTRTKGRELLLYTDSPAWSSRLRFCSRDLARRLATQGLQIQRVRVRISIDRPARPARQAAGRTLSPDNARLLEETARSIDAPGLSRALRRLARHYRR